MSGDERQYDIACVAIETMAACERLDFGKNLSSLIIFAPEMITDIREWQKTHPEAKRPRLKQGDLPALQKQIEDLGLTPIPL